jgi:hypothetical protein
VGVNSFLQQVALLPNGFDLVEIVSENGGKIFGGEVVPFFKNIDGENAAAAKPSKFYNSFPLFAPRIVIHVKAAYLLPQPKRFGGNFAINHGANIAIIRAKKIGRINCSADFF